MNKLVLNFALLARLSFSLVPMQKEKEVINDSNTPLHLLQPDYQVGYGIVSAEDIKKDMDRVLRYLESNTPTRVVDKTQRKSHYRLCEHGYQCTIGKRNFPSGQPNGGLLYSHAASRRSIR